jgi:hypothetical protein
MSQARHRHRRKRCLSCHELFEPDPRTQGHQKYCSSENCQTVRQRLNEKDWRQRNPDCVVYQQSQSREWHRARPNYSRRRRANDPVLAVKNKTDTRVRMQKIRRQGMFDKSKSILTQVAGGQTDKCYLARGSRWLMVRLTKASPLSKPWLVQDNRGRIHRVRNRLPTGKLYDLSGVF